MPFSELLENFLPGDLPFNITSETHNEIAEHVLALPEDLAAEFLMDEGEELDEFTEFMACMRFMINKKIVALVWWRAGLEGNDFFIQTFYITGQKIAKKRIAGTSYNDTGMVHTVASIRRDLSIFIKDGMTSMNREVLLDETSGIIFRLLIHDDGTITKDLEPTEGN